MIKKLKKSIFSKKYLPVTLASILLVILIAALIGVILYKPRLTFEVPDLPKYDDLEMGVVDLTSDNADVNSIDNIKKDKISVDYKLIESYYNDGIFLSNTQVEYVNNAFLIYSGSYAKDQFVSLAEKNGTLKWTKKMVNNSYESYVINAVKYLQNKYYVFLTGTKKDNTKDILALTIDDKGNLSNTVILVEKLNNTLRSVDTSDNDFALITDGTDNVTIYFVNEELKASGTTYSLEEDSINLFSLYKPYIQKSYYNNNQVSVLLYYGNLDTKYYLLTYDKNTKKAKLDSSKDLSNIAANFNSTYFFNDSIYFMTESTINKTTNLGKSMKKYDYGSLKLEDPSKYEYQFIGDDEPEQEQQFTNSFIIDNFNIMDDSIVLRGETAFHNIYDVFDKDLSLKKRYILELGKYSYDDSVLLKTFYIDNKIYEIYSHGTKTPSIMISIIG